METPGELNVRPSFVIFGLLFGAAFVDPLRHQEWLMIVVYVALGLIFLGVGARDFGCARAERDTK